MSVSVVLVQKLDPFESLNLYPTGHCLVLNMLFTSFSTMSYQPFKCPLQLGEFGRFLCSRVICKWLSELRPLLLALFLLHILMFCDFIAVLALPFSPFFQTLFSIRSCLITNLNLLQGSAYYVRRTCMHCLQSCQQCQFQQQIFLYEGSTEGHTNYKLKVIGLTLGFSSCQQFLC